MNLPGFAAEASFYRSSLTYHLASNLDHSTQAIQVQAVIPRLRVICWMAHDEVICVYWR